MRKVVIILLFISFACTSCMRNCDVWYYIHKNGLYVDQSYTKRLVEAEIMLEKFTSGKSSEPIINVLKTIEIDE